MICDGQFLWLLCQCFFFLIITLPLNAVALAFVDMSYSQEVQLPPPQKKTPEILKYKSESFWSFSNLKLINMKILLKVMCHNRSENLELSLLSYTEMFKNGKVHSATHIAQ